MAAAPLLIRQHVCAVFSRRDVRTYFPRRAIWHQRQRRVDGFGVAWRPFPTTTRLCDKSRSFVVKFIDAIRKRDLRIKRAAWAGGRLEAKNQINYFVASMIQCEMFAPLSVWVMDSNLMPRNIPKAS